ncbi:MAG: Bro-N domain-containing protein [Saprospiraceae bacterium]|nr:Bro-N domain-containing protein [Saprospiraceae bacterium]
MDNQSLIPFEDKGIRKIWHTDQWFFSVIDIVEVLTNSTTPRRYWTDLKRKEEKGSGQLYDFVVQLKLTATDGRLRLTDCANTEGIFRIIMSIPSTKAEPLKLWLAEQGKRTIEEVNNPELLTERQAEIYKAKGYSDEWIDRRIKSIDTRKRLTDEWKNRGIKEGQEYSLLTATIAKGTFGLTPSEHAQLKSLDKENLRDHMTPLELILTALSEEVTRTITINDDAQGFHENHEAAVRGGEIGRKALQNVEEGTGQKVVSAQNFLHLKEGEKKEELPPSSDE